MLKPAAVSEIFRKFKAANPEPKTELNYDTPFQLLAAVLLSAQATDISVNLVTSKLFKTVKEPSDLVHFTALQLEQEIKSIGLFRTKAKNLLKTSHILIDKHQGIVPGNRAELEALPGIGAKSAAVLLNQLFNQPLIAVDTHVFRVSNRLGLVNEPELKRVENKLIKKIPSQYLMHAHHWLVLHGRYQCLARRPKCPSCILLNLCQYDKKTELEKK